MRPIRPWFLTLVLAACTRPATSPPSDKPGADPDTTPTETDVVETDTPDSAGPPDTDLPPPDTDTQDTDIPYEVDPWTDDWSIVAPRVRPMAPCTTERARIGTTPYPSAQAALDAAQDFDIVALCPGAHSGGLRLPQVANLEIRSVSANPADTWIEAVEAPDGIGLHAIFAVPRRSEVGRLRLSALSFQTAPDASGRLLYVNGQSPDYIFVDNLELRDINANGSTEISGVPNLVGRNFIHLERLRVQKLSLVSGGTAVARSIVLGGLPGTLPSGLALWSVATGPTTLDDVTVLPPAPGQRRLSIFIGAFPSPSLLGNVLLGPVIVRNVTFSNSVTAPAAISEGPCIEIKTSHISNPMQVLIEDVLVRDVFTTKIVDLDTLNTGAPVTIHLRRADFRNARSPYPGPANDSTMATIDTAPGVTYLFDDVDLRDPGSGSNLLDIADCDQDYGILTRHILDPALGPCPRRRP